MVDKSSIAYRLTMLQYHITCEAIYARSDWHKLVNPGLDDRLADPIKEANFNMSCTKSVVDIARLIVNENANVLFRNLEDVVTIYKDMQEHLHTWKNAIMSTSYIPVKKDTLELLQLFDSLSEILYPQYRHLSGDKGGNSSNKYRDVFGVVPSMSSINNSAVPNLASVDRYERIYPDIEEELGRRGVIMAIYAAGN